MRKLFILLFLLFTTHIYGMAQSQKATVFLLRSVGHDLDQFVPYFIYMDKVLLCNLGESNYSVHEVEPGEHRFHAQYKGKVKSTPETELLVNLESGKTYYISVNLKTKAFGKGSFYCEQLSDEEGEKRAKAFLLNIKCF
jgi:hypothetical protein